MLRVTKDQPDKIKTACEAADCLEDITDEIYKLTKKLYSNDLNKLRPGIIGKLFKTTPKIRKCYE